MENDLTFALRTAATYSVPIIIGIWLIRAGLKRWRANKALTPPHTGAETAKTGTNPHFWLMAGTRLKLVAIVLIAVFLFYWFAYLPRQARQECGRMAEKEASVYDDSDYGYELFNKEFEACMKKRGLPDR